MRQYRQYTSHTESECLFLPGSRRNRFILTNFFIRVIIINTNTTYLTMLTKSIVFMTCLAFAVACQAPSYTEQAAGITYQKWHPLTLSFEGPQTSEQAEENPFLHYRLLVTFRQDDHVYTVPGFYAADGNAAESSADSGNVWQVHFTPDRTGSWEYEVSFRQGENVAVSDDPQAGEPMAFDGSTGTFEVVPSEKNGDDFRARGMLQHAGKRYLQFAETGDYYLKGGTDSPENLLGYEDFDGTYFGGEAGQREGEAAADKKLHRYTDHVKDWHEGDPSWQDGKGKGIIGALNYLDSKGMNSIYFLTLNIEGDGKDVWPYTGYDERYRFDCSKLAQWEKVFSHADSLGIMLHFVTQETENELLLDDGDLGIQRKLYYRELIARFAHHLAVTWNMGEENGYAEFTPDAQNDQQRKDMITYFKQTDPYQHFVALHTHAGRKPRYDILEPLLGFEYLDGPSLQIGSTKDVHAETRHWVEASGEAGKQWVVNLDEIGPHYFGVFPDDVDPEHDTVRHEALWGNLMAGGGGAEWYFGYRYPNDDLNAETYRTRSNMWDQTRYAIEFFHQHLPFWEMQPADKLVEAAGAYCLAKPGEIYALYLPTATTATLDLEESEQAFRVQWYNPRSGGALQAGSVNEVKGPGKVSIGNPPSDAYRDWAVVIQPSE